MTNVLEIVVESIPIGQEQFNSMARSVYGKMSRQVHSTRDSLRPILNMKNYSLQILPDYIEARCDEALTVLVILQWIHLKLIFDIYQKELIDKKLDESILTTLTKLEPEYILNKYNNKTS